MLSRPVPVRRAPEGATARPGDRAVLSESAAMRRTRVAAATRGSRRGDHAKEVP